MAAALPPTYAVVIYVSNEHREALSALPVGARLQLIAENNRSHGRGPRALRVCCEEGRTLCMVPSDHWLYGEIVHGGMYCTGWIDWKDKELATVRLEVALDEEPPRFQ